MSGPQCPCGSGAGFRECCGQYVRGAVAAPTAEALMRSRYTAYVRRDEAYLVSTWHPSTRPAALGLDDTVWLGLDVLRTEGGGEGDATGVVEFEARYVGGGGAVATLRESSRFTRQGGAWLYVDGDVS